jgi:hypothetical protein
MFDRVTFGKRVLLAGCGGGYDVLGAVPLWHALRRDHEVHFASLSFSYLNGLDARQDAEVPNLYEVTERAATEKAYCPEAHLAKFVGQPIWCFDKTGVRPLARAYRALVDRLGIDSIVLVDGGIDAVLRGDELSLGTPSEDLASLAAATMQGVPVTLACVGMTSELRDGTACVALAATQHVLVLRRARGRPHTQVSRPSRRDRLDLGSRGAHRRRPQVAPDSRPLPDPGLSSLAMRYSPM